MNQHTDDMRDVPDYSTPIQQGYSSPGHFENLLREGHFAVTAELAPTPCNADTMGCIVHSVQRRQAADAVYTDGDGVVGSHASRRLAAHFNTIRDHRALVRHERVHAVGQCEGQGLRRPKPC